MTSGRAQSSDHAARVQALDGALKANADAAAPGGRGKVDLVGADAGRADSGEVRRFAPPAPAAVTCVFDRMPSTALRPASATR